MSKKVNLKVLFTMMMVALLSFNIVSCSSDDDEKLDDGSSNTTDVAVTSNVSKLGVTYAHIDGYVNLNLITSSYTSQQVGIELAMTEDFVNARQAKSKELEGNKLTVVIDTLSAQTKYYYRTFVKVNDLNYYGEKRSFTTKDFSNITSTGDASDLTFTSAKIKCKGDASSIDKDNNFSIGIAYSTSKSRLHPDSAYIGYDPYYGYYSRGFTVAECSLDSLIKNKSFEKTISRLQTGTTYYYCSFTRAGKKYKLGDVKSFSTKSLSDVQLSTGDATDITFTSATIQNTSSIASLCPEGTSIQYGIRFGTSNDALYETAYPYETATSQEGSTFTVQLRNLQAGKTYYYCAVAYVDGLYIYGETKNFTTKSGAEYLKAGEASNITMTSATVKGTTTLESVYNNGSSIQYRIMYGTNSNLTTSSSTATPELSGTTLTAELTNLTMATTYYYCVRAYVNGSYIYSDTKSFTTKDIQTTGYVDLGVSCQWASCNLGATTPEDYGDYYAWGETETRTFFYSSNYSKKRSEVPNNISGTDYDAARKNLGNPWRMPTQTEFQEILNICFWKEITYKNVKGYLVTGKNGNAIFLPKTGYKSGDGTNNGYAIWTGSGNYVAETSYTWGKCDSYYWSGTTLSTTQNYYYGMTIRPVR